ncbi:MAG: polysaccharide biosynthesis tyrosine autokinase [Thermodesulfobacteriota bacterium]
MGKVFDALEKSNQKPKPVSGMFKIEQQTGTDTRQDTKTDEASNLRSSDIGLRLDNNLIAFSDAQSFEAEQFKSLKTNILFPADGKVPRVIMVTSALPNEGKSFVASNLAISISQNIDDHVLLIDCDLRLPTVHTLFGLGEGPGLSNYLSSNKPLPGFLRRTNIGKLNILPGGPPPKNPAELLTSEKMAQLIAEVRERYPDRYVIMDTAPPQLTAESNAIARKVDGILVVVNYRKTRRENVEQLINMIGKEKIIGIILNRFDMRASSYYGYGKYSDYSKYYLAR